LGADWITETVEDAKRNKEEIIEGKMVKEGKGSKVTVTSYSTVLASWVVFSGPDCCQ
jgi:hypothetical protein